MAHYTALLFRAGMSLDAVRKLGKKAAYAAKWEEWKGHLPLTLASPPVADADGDPVPDSDEDAEADAEDEGESEDEGARPYGRSTAGVLAFCESLAKK